MTICKANKAGSNTPREILHHVNGMGFTTSFNFVMNLIPDPIAYAIFHYLLSKPSNWIIRPAELMSRFSVGRDTIKSRIKILKDLGLYDRVAVRRADGSIDYWRSDLYEIPKDIMLRIQETGFQSPGCESTKNQETGLPPTGSATDWLNNPLTNKRSLTNERLLQNPTTTKSLQDSKCESLVEHLSSSGGEVSQEGKGREEEPPVIDRDTDQAILNAASSGSHQAKDDREYLEWCKHWMNHDCKATDPAGKLRVLLSILKANPITKPKSLGATQEGTPAKGITDDQHAYQGYLMTVNGDIRRGFVAQDYKPMDFKTWAEAGRPSKIPSSEFI